MNRRFYSATTGGFIGVFAGIPWLAIAYLGEQLAGFPLMHFDFFEWVIQLLPGKVIAIVLEILIGGLQSFRFRPTDVLGKTIEGALAVCMALMILGLIGTLFGLYHEVRSPGLTFGALVAGMMLWLLVVPVTKQAGWGAISPWSVLAWLLMLCLVWGFALSWGVTRSVVLLDKQTDRYRRSFLLKLGLSSLALGGLSFGIGRWLETASKKTSFQSSIVPIQPRVTPSPNLTGFQSVSGIREEITPISKFFRIDINLRPPSPDDVSSEVAGNLAEVLRAQGDSDFEVSENSYVLLIDGLVQRPLGLSLDELRDLPMVEQYATLECISNRVGGDLIGTTLFKGTPLNEVLVRAGLRSEASEIKFTCIDGYSESLPIASALDSRTLLCYAMGGESLTPNHGSPLRLYTPNRFGMKNPKWVIKIEAVAEDYLGYWEQRGWSDEAWVKTTSVIDSIASLAPGLIEVGGIAFAGARQIRKVELQIDDGEWIPAELKYPLSPLTWVLWRASLELDIGRHRLTVRAEDGKGEVQTDVRSTSLPEGATGYHSREINIEG